MNEFFGWAIAITAYRQLNAQFQIRLNVFTVGTFELYDAVECAKGLMRKDFPHTEGWEYIVVSKTIVKPLPNDH